MLYLYLIVSPLCIYQFIFLISPTGSFIERDISFQQSDTLGMIVKNTPDNDCYRFHSLFGDKVNLTCKQLSLAFLMADL